MPSLLPALLETIDIRSFIQKLEEDASKPELTRTERARILLQIAEKQDERDTKIEALLGGEVLTPTAVAFKLSERTGSKFSASDVNKMLIDTGFQTRDPENRNNYTLTDQAKSCEIGVVQVQGRLICCRWNEIMVDVLVEHLTKEE